MKEHNSFEIIGTTLDDAIGECFDKVAKILGLPYPGGPSVAKAAEKGDPDRYKFPHPRIEGLNFSFSGLKTAVLRTVQKECGVGIDFPSHDLKNLLNEKQIADFSASFQKTAVDILLEKVAQAKTEHPDAKSIVFAGGVSANSALRNAAKKKFASSSNDNMPNNTVALFFPSHMFSGDNAAMVAMAAYYEIKSGIPPTDPYSLDISPRSAIA